MEKNGILFIFHTDCKKVGKNCAVKKISKSVSLNLEYWGCFQSDLLVWMINLKFQMSLNMKAYTFLLGEYVKDCCRSAKRVKTATFQHIVHVTRGKLLEIRII
jgi:hypothetical protein